MSCLQKTLINDMKIKLTMRVANKLECSYFSDNETPVRISV